MSFKLDNPKFTQKSKVSFYKGKNNVNNFNHWFNKKGKKIPMKRVFTSSSERRI